jgi:hypothetical protein
VLQFTCDFGTVSLLSFILITIGNGVVLVGVGVFLRCSCSCRPGGLAHRSSVGSVSILLYCRLGVGVYIGLKGYWGGGGAGAVSLSSLWPRKNCLRRICGRN